MDNSSQDTPRRRPLHYSELPPDLQAWVRPLDEDDLRRAGGCSIRFIRRSMTQSQEQEQQTPNTPSTSSLPEDKKE